jgi:hypothetical protein
MQFAMRPRKTLDGRYLPALGLGGERQAGQDALAVEVTGAGAALSLIATLLGTSEAKMFTKRVKQRDAGLNIELMALPVDVERKMYCSCHESSCYRHEYEVSKVYKGWPRIGRTLYRTYPWDAPRDFGMTFPKLLD